MATATKTPAKKTAAKKTAAKKTPAKKSAAKKSASAKGNPCWDGFKPVPGKKPMTKGSCEKD